MHRLVIALTSLLTLVGAGVVGLHLFLSARVADPAANVIPADAQVYISVYLEPSPAQRANLAALLGRLPGFADQAALDQKIEQIATNLLGQAGIDYAADVEPWLGGQVAIGVTRVAPDGGDGDGVVVFAVKDRQAAEDALARLVAREAGERREQDHQGTTLHLDESGAGYAFVGEAGEMVVFGSGEEQLRAALDAAEDRAESLADQPAFRTTMASLPADNLASIYVDVAAVAAAAGAAEEEIPGLSSFAAALIAEERGMRLAGRLPLERDALDAAAAAVLDETGGEPTLAGWMPADTKLEIVTFGVADAIRAAEADESEASSVVAQLRAGLGLGLGLDLDEDVLPLLDGEVGIAVSQLELSGAVPPVGQVLLKPADRAVVEGTLGRIRDALEGRGAAVTTREAGGTTVTTVEVPQAGAASYAVVDGVVVIGLAPEHVLAALEARSAGETLGETEAYATAFGLLERHAGPELFLDLQGLLGVAGQFGFDAGQLAALPADARAILERVEALALATPTSADAVEIHAVLTVR